MHLCVYYLFPLPRMSLGDDFTSVHDMVEAV